MKRGLVHKVSDPALAQALIGQWALGEFVPRQHLDAIALHLVESGLIQT